MEITKSKQTEYVMKIEDFLKELKLSGSLERISVDWSKETVKVITIDIEVKE